MPVCVVVDVFVLVVTVLLVPVVPVWDVTVSVRLESVEDDWSVSESPQPRRGANMKATVKVFMFKPVFNVGGSK